MLDRGRRHAIFRAAKFGVATSAGFLVNDAILVLGIFAVYRIIEMPSLIDPAFTLTVVGLNAFSLLIGTTVAFVVNERVTVRAGDRGPTAGWRGVTSRWARYQAVAFAGNLVVIGVQFALLAGISLHPALGNVVGAVAAYPMTYVISMRFVWSVNPFSG